MTRLSNFDREMGEQRVEQERAAQVEALRNTLTRAGKTHCIDCEEMIEASRRIAMPSATRCITCQQKKERKT